MHVGAAYFLSSRTKHPLVEASKDVRKHGVPQTLPGADAAGQNQHESVGRRATRYFPSQQFTKAEMLSVRNIVSFIYAGILSECREQHGQYPMYQSRHSESGLRGPGGFSQICNRSNLLRLPLFQSIDALEADQMEFVQGLRVRDRILSCLVRLRSGCVARGIPECTLSGLRVMKRGFKHSDY